MVAIFLLKRNYQADCIVQYQCLQCLQSMLILSSMKLILKMLKMSIKTIFVVYQQLQPGGETFIKHSLCLNPILLDILRIRVKTMPKIKRKRRIGLIFQNLVSLRPDPLNSICYKPSSYYQHCSFSHYSSVVIEHSTR